MANDLQPSVAKPTFAEAWRFWLKLGFISFGGPAGQIALMLEQKKRVSDSRFLHALNYCMLLPSPEAQQLATYLAWVTVSFLATHRFKVGHESLDWPQRPGRARVLPDISLFGLIHQ